MSEARSFSSPSGNGMQLQEKGPHSLQVLKAITRSRVHKKTSLCIGLLWKSLPSRWRARVIAQQTAAFWSRHEVWWPKWRNHGKPRVCGFVLHLRPHLSLLFSSNDPMTTLFFFFLQHLSEVDQNCLPRQQKNERTGLDNILLLDTWVTANGLQLLRELNTSALVLLKVSVNHILAYWQCMCYILAAHRIIMDHYFREGKYSNVNLI